MAVRSPSQSPTGSPALAPFGVHAGKPALPMGRPFTLVGSRHRAHLHLLSRTISKSHAIIVNDNGGLYVRDLASREGVYINDKPVREADLHDGDVLRIGSFSFTFSQGREQAAGPARAPEASLEIAGQPLPTLFEGRTLLIGRRPTCDIPLSDMTVSTVHAVIFELNGKHHIRDLGSRTGTLVNGQPIHQQALAPQDQIRVGDTEMRFVSAAALIADDELLPAQKAARKALEEVNRRAMGDEPIPLEMDEPIPLENDHAIPLTVDEGAAPPAEVALPVEPHEPADAPAGAADAPGPNLAELDLAADADLSASDDTRAMPPDRDLAPPMPVLSSRVVDSPDAGDGLDFADEGQEVLVGADLHHAMSASAQMPAISKMPAPEQPLPETPAAESDFGLDFLPAENDPSAEPAVASHTGAPEEQGVDPAIHPLDAYADLGAPVSAGAPREEASDTFIHLTAHEAAIAEPIADSPAPSVEEVSLEGAANEAAAPGEEAGAPVFQFAAPAEVFGPDDAVAPPEEELVEPAEETGEPAEPFVQRADESDQPPVAWLPPADEAEELVAPEEPVIEEPVPESTAPRAEPALEPQTLAASIPQAPAAHALEAEAAPIPEVQAAHALEAEGAPIPEAPAAHAPEPEAAPIPEVQAAHAPEPEAAPISEVQAAQALEAEAAPIPEAQAEQLPQAQPAQMPDVDIMPPLDISPAIEAGAGAGAIGVTGAAAVPALAAEALDATASALETGGKSKRKRKPPAERKPPAPRKPPAVRKTTGGRKRGKNATDITAVENAPSDQPATDAPLAEPIADSSQSPAEDAGIEQQATAFSPDQTITAPADEEILATTEPTPESALDFEQEVGSPVEDTTALADVQADPLSDTGFGRAVREFAGMDSGTLVEEPPAADSGATDPGEAPETASATQDAAFTIHSALAADPGSPVENAFAGPETVVEPGALATPDEIVADPPTAAHAVTQSQAPFDDLMANEALGSDFMPSASADDEVAANAVAFLAHADGESEAPGGLAAGDELPPFDVFDADELLGGESATPAENVQRHDTHPPSSDPPAPEPLATADHIGPAAAPEPLEVAITAADGLTNIDAPATQVQAPAQTASAAVAEQHIVFALPAEGIAVEATAEPTPLELEPADTPFDLESALSESDPLGQEGDFAQWLENFDKAGQQEAAHPPDGQTESPIVPAISEEPIAAPAELPIARVRSEEPIAAPAELAIAHVISEEPTAATIAPDALGAPIAQEQPVASEAEPADHWFTAPAGAISPTGGIFAPPPVSFEPIPASPAPPVGLSAPPAPQAAPDVEVLPPPIAPASDPLFGMSRDFGTFLGGVPLMLAPTAAAPPTFGDRPVVVRRDPLGLSPGHAAQVRQPLIEPGPPRHEQANANANTNVELTDQTATRAMAPVSDAAAPPNSSPASAPARGQSPADEPPELFDATPEALDTLPDDSLEAISDVTQVLGEAPMAPAAHAPAPPPAPSRPAAMGTRPAPDARGGKTPARPPVRAVIPPPPAGAPVTRRPAPGARPGAGRAATAGAPPAGPFDGLVLPADVFSQMPVSGAVFGAPEVRARGGASSGAGAPGQRRLAVARPPTARQPGDAPPAAHTKTPAVRKPAEGPPAAPAKATASRKPAAPEKPVEQIQPARSIEPAADRLAPDSFDHASPPDAPEAHMGDVPSPEPRKKKKRKFPFLGLLLLLACAGGAAAGVWFLLAPTADVRAAIRFQGLDKYDPAKAADFARARADELRGTGATGNDVRTTAQKSYEAAFGAGGAGFLYGRTDADAAAFDSILHSAHVEGDRLILDDAKSHHAQRDARQFRALLKVFYALNASQGDAAAIQKAGLDRLQTAVAQAEQQIGELQQRSAERAKAQGEYAIAVQNVKDVTARAAKTQQVWSNAAGAARKLQADLDAIVSGAPAGQATSGDDDPQVSDLAQHLQELNGSLSAAWAAQGGDAAAAVSQALTPFQQDIDTYSAASAGGPAVADYLANARRGQRAMHQAIDDFGQQRRLNQQALEDLNRALAEPSPGILEANLLGQVLSAQTAKLKGDLGRLDEVLGAQLDLLGSAAPAPESLSSEGRQIVEQLSRRLLAVKAARQQVTGALASIGSGNAIASLENQLAQTRTALDARRRQLAAAPANGAVPGDAALAAASAKRTQIELTQTQRAKALADWEVAQRDATAAQEALDKLRPGQVDFSRDNSQLLALQLKRSGLASELDRQKANTILYPEDPDRDEAVHITRQTDVRGYVMAALGVLFAFLAGALIARRQHQSQPPFADHFSGLEHDESGAIHSRSGEPVGV